MTNVLLHPVMRALGSAPVALEVPGDRAVALEKVNRDQFEASLLLETRLHRRGWRRLWMEAFLAVVGRHWTGDETLGQIVDEFGLREVVLPDAPQT